MPSELFERPVTRERSGSLETGLAHAERFFIEKDFPIMQEAQAIKRALHTNDTILIEAETGSGKSTAAPVLILNELYQDNPYAKVVVTQPRRIAAEGLAEYVGEHVGNRFVGFHHKNKDTRTQQTQLEFTVEGSLLNQLIADNKLMKYDAVILDEVHERSVNLDVLMALLKDAQRLRREEGLKRLKIVLASATVDHVKFLQYFDDTEHIHVPGRTFDVEHVFEEERIDPRDVMLKAAQKAIQILKDPNSTGDILVFMPGKFEIDRTYDEVKRLLEQGALEAEVKTLMGGDQSSESYKEVNKQSTLRKVIIASGVARTSITIPTVRSVISPGLSRTSKFDKDSGITSIQTFESTKDYMLQEAGRAGGVANGTAYFLMTKEEFDARDSHHEPEIFRTDLAAQILKMKQLGVRDVEAFDFLDHPGVEQVRQAVEALQFLDALDSSGQITHVGNEMLEYDTNPHYAKMLVEAKERGCIEEVALLIGLMNEKSVFMLPKGQSFRQKYEKYIHEESDPLTLLNIWNEYVDHNEDKEDRKKWGEDNAIRTRSLFNAFGTAQDLLKITGKKSPQKFSLTDEKRKQITFSIFSGLVDRILLTNNSYGIYELRNGKKQGIKIGRQSVLSGKTPTIVASGNLRTIERTKQTFAEMNIAATEEMVKEFIPQFKLEKPMEEERQKEQDMPDVSEDIQSTASHSTEEDQPKEHQDSHDETSFTSASEPHSHHLFSDREQHEIIGRKQKIKHFLKVAYSRLKRVFGIKSKNGGGH